MRATRRMNKELVALGLSFKTGEKKQVHYGWVHLELHLEFARSLR